MRLKLALHIFFIVVALVIALIAVTDIIDVLSASSQYIFGTEVGGWKYESRYNFLIFNGIQAVIGLSIFAVLLVSVLRMK